MGGSWALVDGEQLVAGVNNQGIPAKILYDESGGRRGDIFAAFPGLDMVLTKAVSYTATERGLRVRAVADPHTMEGLASAIALTLLNSDEEV